MLIQINGHDTDTDLKSLYELKEKYGSGCEVVIFNGFQTAENFMLNNGDTVFFIKKGIMPSENELEAMMSARHTPKVHEKVKNASVAIAGLGGLGSNIAVMLARTGVGKMLLVDFDIVEPSNLNRQSYYISHLGMFKTDAVKNQIEQINPFIKIETKCIRVTDKNIKELFSDYDIICEAFDNPISKAVIVNGIIENFPDKKIVSGSGMAGYESSNLIKTKKCFKNLYICGDGINEAKVGNGLMSPRVSICAGHQANMILRLILGIDEV